MAIIIILLFLGILVLIVKFLQKKSKIIKELDYIEYEQSNNTKVTDENLTEKIRFQYWYEFEYRCIPFLVNQFKTVDHNVQLFLQAKTIFTEQIICDVKYEFDWYNYHVNLIQQNGNTYIIYKFPYIELVPAAKYGIVSIKNKQQDVRYYTMEKSFSNSWILGSKDNDTHINYGPLENSNLKTMFNRIKTI